MVSFCAQVFENGNLFSENRPKQLQLDVTVDNRSKMFLNFNEIIWIVEIRTT